MKTTAHDVIEIFESSFRDKEIIPFELELKWLEKAVAWHSMENGLDLEYNPVTHEFSGYVDPFIQATLAQHIRVYYQERETSKVNHRVSIVTKDISIDGNGNSKTAARAELEYHRNRAEEMEGMQFITAYAD